MLQFLINDAPTLLTHLLQTREQVRGGGDGAAGLGLQVDVFEVLLQRHIVQRRQQDAPH